MGVKIKKAFTLKREKAFLSIVKID